MSLHQFPSWFNIPYMNNWIKILAVRLGVRHRRGLQTGGQRLPKPPGPYTVGLRQFEFEAGGRRTKVYTWHPAAAPTGAIPRRCNTPAESEAFAQSFVVLGAPDAADRTLVDIATATFELAPVRSGCYPLVVFNHGGLLNPLINFTLMQHLASSGYVVCSLGHAGESSGLVWADGSLTAVDPGLPAAMQMGVTALGHYARFLLAADETARRTHLRDFLAADSGVLAGLSRAWSADSVALVDRLFAKDPDPALAPLAAVIDRSRLAYAGMSLGGSAAYDSCMADPRATVGINLDGANWNFAGIDQDCPASILQLYSDPSIDQGQLAAIAADLPEGLRARTPGKANDFHYEMPAARGRRNDIIRVTIKGADHNAFTDRPLTELIALGATIDAPGPPIMQINALCAAFLDWRLKGRSRRAFDRMMAQDHRFQVQAPTAQ
jgi:hypothetical protein